MFVLSPDKMKNYDKFTIENFGLEGIVLMENAGKKAAEIIETNLIKEDNSIAVVCGTGNNAGDGFVVARWLFNHGYDVCCFVIGNEEKFSPSAKKNYGILDKLSCEIVFISNDDAVEYFANELPYFDVIADAMFGIGLKGKIKGYRKKIIELINKHIGIKVAIDIPSGVNAETGEVANVAVNSDFTLTMAALKYGHLLFPGREYSGKVYVIDIGISPLTYAENPPEAEVLEEIESFFPSRKSNSDKTDYGKIAIIAGSAGLTGAAIMASKSALEIGSGLIKLIHPRSLSPIFENSLIEIMSKTVNETDSQTISFDALDEILEFTKNSNAIAIGPGISRNESTARFVREFLKQNTKLTVIDADGINAFQDHLEELKYLNGKPYIFTPHIREFSRLIDLPVEKIETNLLEHTRKFAKKYNVIILLKGATSVICNNKETTFNVVGNPGLSTGGNGDVLTGIIVSLLGQGFSEYDAARVGSFILGKTADILLKDFGERSLTPTKIIKNLYKSMQFGVH
ncbi:MAG: NAD(P)H-hydrate dehydratase [Candidatus Cloacimonadota bacterium]|nr:NAD(P)H-hydrate dehydratase [Candidatus Cloacimonadota bacterium]